MKPELASPAGNLVMLKAAIQAGADAIYFGVNKLNMRITAKNFEVSEIKKVVDECHKNKVKAYLVLNTIIYENEINIIKKILTEAKKAKVDAVICWDHSIIKLCSQLKINIHLSTQAAVSNSEAALFYKKLGVKRIVLARECSLKQIKEIKDKANIEIETFIHGAMCVSISGRCFISQHLFKKSANRGDCLQPCRRGYIVQDYETGDKLALGRNYILSPKDLCTLPFLEQLIKAGISSFKIEGRVRSPEYVKIVTEVYREAIDNQKSDNKKLLDKLKTVYNRKFSSGFYLGLPTSDDFTDIYGSNAKEKKQYIGYIKNFYKKINVCELKIESSKLRVGDTIMFQGNKTGVVRQKLTSMELNHKKIKFASKGKSIAVKTDEIIRPNDKVFLLK